MSIVVFADGASSGNPGPGGWGAIIVDEAKQVHELGGGDRQTTNNRMELSAVCNALRSIRERLLPGSKIDVYTDSTYVIRGITQWVHGWKRNGWKTAEGKDVLNRELWEQLSDELRQADQPVSWNYVPGHAGIHGNERADEIAVQISRGLAPQLYEGPVRGYSVPILEIPSKAELERLLHEREKREKKTAPAGGPSYYLSLVGRTPARHATWAECEARVKGVSGARFKKVSSLEEEKEILKSWGYYD
jgi:ribonuclease HI